jgi:hypothetical protein
VGRVSAVKVCPGYGQDGPHELPATEEHFYVNHQTGVLRSPCRPHYKQRYGGQKGIKWDRAEERRGVYLAVVKTLDGYLVKIGKTGDGVGGFRTRAGSLAKDARLMGIDAIWAEVFWVIEFDDAETRALAEDKLLSGATPVVGDEYFKVEDYLLFHPVFHKYGSVYNERRTFDDRWDEFRRYLKTNHSWEAYYGQPVRTRALEATAA